MRFLMVLLVSFIMTNSCEKNSISNMHKIEISYEEMTRGYRQNIVINKDKIVVDLDKRGVEHSYEKTISKDEALSLGSILNEMDLKKIETYPAPSNKSRFDGAAMANLVIKKGNESYNSQTFDAGNPPLELKNLVDKIIEISKN